jgi:CRISPR-associated endonuclease Csy4
MTPSKLNGSIRRDSISAEEIKNYTAKMFSQSLDNAYLDLESSSNGHKHRRYLNFGELQEKSVERLLDSFGLSKQATIHSF